MARDADQETRPVIIKKYANRRLYNTDTSTYVTLEDLAEMVRGRARLCRLRRQDRGRPHPFCPDPDHRRAGKPGHQPASHRLFAPAHPLLRRLDAEAGAELSRVQPRFAHPPAGAISPAIRPCLRHRRLRGDAGAGAQEFRDVRKGARPVHSLCQGRAARRRMLMASRARNMARRRRCSAKPDDEIATLKAELSAMQQRLEQLSRR